MFGDVPGLDDQFAAYLAVVDLRADAAGIGKQGGACGAHLLQFAQAALITPPARGHAAQQPARFVLQPAVEALGFARFFVQHLLAPVVERAESLAGLAQPAFFEPQDAVGDFGEESTVVAYDQRRAAEALHGAFKPLDGGDIQMVGRFVEQQQVGRIDEDLGERRPALLAAGKAGDVAPAVQFEEGERGLHGVARVRRLRPARCDIGRHPVEHAPAGFHDGLLGQVGDGEARLAIAFAGVEFQFAGDQLHQGRFSAAVAADQAGDVALCDMQGQPLEQGRAAETDRGVAQGKQGRRRHGSGFAATQPRVETKRRLRKDGDPAGVGVAGVDENILFLRHDGRRDRQHR